jgi:putative transcriptional regulator
LDPEWTPVGSIGPQFLRLTDCVVSIALLMVKAMASIKTQLRVLRAEREWSQTKLAVVVEVTRQTINSIEKGRYHPNLRLAFKIARAFGKLIEEVFLYEDHSEV